MIQGKLQLQSGTIYACTSLINSFRVCSFFGHFDDRVFYSYRYHLFANFGTTDCL